MNKSAAARRFAKALIAIGREDGSCEAMGRGLRTALGVFKDDPELYKVLLNPMYSMEERKGLMDEVSEAVGISPAVRKFLGVLVETHSIKLLPEIVTSYVRYEDEFAGRIRASLEAPSEPPQEILAEIKEKLEAFTGKEIILSYIKNTDLVGGMVIHMGNTVIDGSLKTQIEAMRERIIEGV